MPLANGFLNRNQLRLPEPFYPVNIYFCLNCGLVQLADTVEKEALFKEYAYFSSVSRTFVGHSEKLAAEIAERFTGSPDSLVVEVGSNDGVLLKPLISRNVGVLGVEPARNVAEVARRSGIETISDFFTTRLAKRIVKNKGKASVIVSCNVFNHLNDLDDVMEGIRLLLKDDGVFLIEVPYLVDLLNNGAFDTMYHEMHSYFAVNPLMKLFEMYGMMIFDVKRISLHTGSIRVYVRRSRDKEKENRAESVNAILSLEKEMRLHRLHTYLRFAKQVEAIKRELVGLLLRIKNDGKRIIGYGAPAKGNVLLNYCGIGTEVIDYIVDATPYKQGLYTPGMHIPVHPPEKFRQDYPDYALLLPWNFREEIIGKERQFRANGGRFIVPLPSPTIV